MTLRLRVKSHPSILAWGQQHLFHFCMSVICSDAIGRTWQCSTVQCDFNLPDRFNLEYVASEVGYRLSTHAP